MSLSRLGLAGALSLALSACAVVPKSDDVSHAPAMPPVPRGQPTRPLGTPADLPRAPAGQNASGAGIQPGPPIAELGITPDNAGRALAAFRASCPSLIRRADASGLTAPRDWYPACLAAANWRQDDALAFFSTHLETAVIGEGASFVTGYYEPEILGSRARQPGYDVPIYRRPPDLIDVDLGTFVDTLKGKRIRGRVNGTDLVPYHERREIDGGALAGRGLEIAWAADPIEFFFLQIQGSGRLRLPDGSIMRIGYDSQNGRDFTGIGGLLRDRGVLQPGQASMQGIMAYLRAQPDGGRSLMHENKSFIFFRELNGGPLGALGVEVMGRISAAADPAYVPLGAPFILSLDRSEANGLWVAQDTGGAIKGLNRFDTFWGAGDEARTIAGGMSARGKAWLLLPKGVVPRGDGGVDGGPQPQR